MEDLVICSVCLRKFNDPRVLPCQHTFCLKPCLEKLFDVNFRQIKCPLCRVAHIITKGYVTSLPKNFTIRSLMDLSAEKIEKCMENCPLCNSQVNELVKCECCLKSICKICYKAHIDKLKENLVNLNDNLKKNLSTERNSHRKVLDEISSAENEKKKLILEIDHSFNEINSFLKKRKSYLIDEITKKFDPTLNHLKIIEETMEIDVAVLSSSVQSITDSIVRENVSIGHLLALLNSIKTTMPSVKSPSVLHSFVIDKNGEFSFDIDQIKNSISNFGNLNWSKSDNLLSSDSQNNLSDKINRDSASYSDEIIVPKQPVTFHNFNIDREKTYVINKSFKSIAYEIPTNISIPMSLQCLYMTKGLPKLSFGTKGTGIGEFIWPRGIAVDNETSRIFVADSSNHRVQIFSDDGHFIKVISTLKCDHEISVDFNLKFDCLSGIAFGKHEKIVCSDRYHHRVIVMDTDGKVFCEIGKNSSENKAELSYPWGIAIDSNQNILICDKDNHRIQVFSKTGEYIKEIGSHGSQCGLLDNPHYLAVCPKTKNIFVSDTSNHRIQVFDKQGAYLYSFNGDGPTKFHLKYPRGITIDNEGNVLICDYGNNRISIFTNQGKSLFSFGSHGGNVGQFKGLEGIAVFKDGRIVVSDRDNHRIQIF